MRPSCFDCARKHLAQAIVLETEMRTGYPDFKWLVIAHIAEAEAELVAASAELANELREIRKIFEEDSNVDLPLMPMISRISELADSPPTTKRGKK